MVTFDRRQLLRTALAGGLAIGAAPLFDPRTVFAEPAGGRAAPAWLGAGPLRNVYDPSPAEGAKRYLNDHCVIQGPDGTWHLYSIVGDTAPPGEVPDSAVEDAILHATAPALTGPWTTRVDALTTDPGYFGEDHLWAPHVIEHDGTYYMFYSAGSADPAQGWAINLATSTDLSTWTRLESGPLFRQGNAARDPMVLRVGDEWVMYYTEVDRQRHHIVAARTSPDLRTWSDWRAVFTAEITDATVSVTESPYVVERDGWWYLFIGTRNGYVGTDVFASQDPFAFTLDGYAGHVPAHCAEVVRDGEDWAITAAGWFQDGLHTASLRWRDAPPLWHSPRNPAVAVDAAGEVRLFALAADATTLVTRTPDTAWQEFGADFATVPTIGVNADGRLEVFAVRPDASAAARTQNADGSWQEWRDFGGPLAAAPATARDAAGHLELFALAPAGTAILHRRQTSPGGQEWTEWQEFGGPAGAPPAVAANADGRLEVVALGPGGGNVASRWQTSPGGPWSPWDGGFGGFCGSAPTIALGAGDLLQVMVIEPMGLALHHRAQARPSGGWAAWQKFHQWTDKGAANLVADAEDRLAAFYMPPGGDVLYLRVQNADGSWGERREFGTGPVTATPSACLDAQRRLRVFTVAPDGTVHARSQTEPGGDWGEWQALDGDPVAPVPAGSPT